MAALYMATASGHVMIELGGLVAVVGQRGISFGENEAPLHIKAFQISLQPDRMSELFDIDLIFLHCSHSETLRDGQGFSPNGLTIEQKYVKIPIATKGYGNIFLQKVHGLLLQQHIRVLFLILPYCFGHHRS